MGGATDASATFNKGADVTPLRSLNIRYTNGGRRRFCFVTIVASASMIDEAFAGYSTVLGGMVIEIRRAVGLPAGLAATIRAELVFPIDPEADYQVLTDVGTGGLLSINKWLEVDF